MLTLTPPTHIYNAVDSTSTVEVPAGDWSLTMDRSHNSNWRRLVKWMKTTSPNSIGEFKRYLHFTVCPADSCKFSQLVLSYMWCKSMADCNLKNRVTQPKQASMHKYIPNAPEAWRITNGLSGRGVGGRKTVWEKYLSGRQYPGAACGEFTSFNISRVAGERWARCVCAVLPFDTTCSNPQTGEGKVLGSMIGGEHYWIWL